MHRCSSPTAQRRIFLQRDAASKRSLCCRPVSVRLVGASSNFFLSQVPHHPSFLTKSAVTQFQGEPLQRERKLHGEEKNEIFG